MICIWDKIETPKGSEAWTCKMDQILICVMGREVNGIVVYQWGVRNWIKNEEIRPDERCLSIAQGKWLAERYVKTEIAGIK